MSNDLYNTDPARKEIAFVRAGIGKEKPGPKGVGKETKVISFRIPADLYYEVKKMVQDFINQHKRSAI